MAAVTNLDGQIFRFTCSSRHTRPKKWGAKLTFIQMSGIPYVASLAVDGDSYTFIIGHYINGFYISIPSLFKSADIAQLYDIAYNEPKLRKAGLSVRLAVTFSKGLWIMDSLLN